MNTTPAAVLTQLRVIAALDLASSRAYRSGSPERGAILAQARTSAWFTLTREMGVPARRAEPLVMGLVLRAEARRALRYAAVATGAVAANETVLTGEVFA